MKTANWMVNAGYLEGFAREAGQRTLTYLVREGYIKEDVFDKLVYRLTFTYKPTSCWVRWWKKLWPNYASDEHILLLAVLQDKLEEPLDGKNMPEKVVE